MQRSGRRSLAVLTAFLLGAALLTVPAAPAAAVTAIPMVGMNAAPSARPWLGCFCANPDGWFDPAQGATNTTAEVANMARAGGRLARVEFPWFLIEPTEDTFAWDRVDHIVSAVKDAGLLLHVQVLYPPSWAASGSTTPGPSCQVVNNTYASGIPSAADFGAFVTALVRHVKNTNPGGLPYLEIGNEYDSSHYFNGTPAQYATSELIPGYNAAKAVDPTIKVLMAGWAGSYHTTWFQAAVDAGAGGHFDIVSFHSYGGGAWPLDAAAWNRSYLDSHGFSHIPLWLTEFGWAEWGTNDTAQQSTVNAVLGASSSLQVAEFYEVRDDDVYGAAGAICQREPYGFMDHDEVTTKAGYVTWQQQANGGAVATVDDATTGSGAHRFSYTGTWGATSGTGDGRYNGTTHWSNTANSMATVSFVGNRVRVFANLSAGGGQAQISVDGGPAATVDTYSAIYQTGRQVWDSGVLTSGDHWVSIWATGNANPASTNAWIDLDRVIVRSATLATVDDSTTGGGQNQIAYSGTWGITTGTSDGRYAATTHWSNTAGSTATLTFVGSRARVRTNLSAGGGRASIALDGGGGGTVDTYSPTYATDREVWDSGPLSYGTHTVTVAVLGTANPASTNAWVDLDRFDVS